MTQKQRAALEEELIVNIKARLPELEQLYNRINEESNYEDAVYRYYHTSYKVYRVQDLTLKIVEVLKSLQPKCPLNPRFVQILEEGTGKAFDLKHNSVWAAMARPMLEAFFHARFMLEMTIKYGKELTEPAGLIPFGWGGVLYLYDIR